jgi:hypothetical protein
MTLGKTSTEYAPDAHKPPRETPYEQARSRERDRGEREENAGSQDRTRQDKQHVEGTPDMDRGMPVLVLTPTLMLVLMVSRKQETVCARPARGTKRRRCT